MSDDDLKILDNLIGWLQRWAGLWMLIAFLGWLVAGLEWRGVTGGAAAVFGLGVGGLALWYATVRGVRP